METLNSTGISSSIHVAFLSGCVAVQFYLWFNFSFPLFKAHNHTLPYTKTKENKNQTENKIEPQQLHFRTSPTD